MTEMSLYLENKIVLYLNLYLNTAGEFEFHQSVNSLSGGIGPLMIAPVALTAFTIFSADLSTSLWS